MILAVFNHLLILTLLLFPVVTASGQNTPEQLPASEASVSPAGPTPDVETIIRTIDRVYRADSSYARLEMRIVTENWERTLDMECWSEGMDKTFIVINAPLKDKGITTLRVGNQMWNYFPKIDRVMKIPPSMMMGSWMGSDFTNDDLVKESTFLDDYTCRLITGEDPGCYYLELIPKPETVTVWARVVVRAGKDTLLPREQLYYDENGTLMRRINFSDVKILGGRKIPTVMTLLPTSKPGNKTIITYIRAEFNLALDRDTFTLRNLQKKR